MQCAKLTSPKRKPTIFHVKINLLVCRDLVRILQWQITKTHLVKKAQNKQVPSRILGSRSHYPNGIWAIHKTTGQKKHIQLSALFLIYVCLSLHCHPQPQQETTVLIFQGEHHAGTRHPKLPSGLQANRISYVDLPEGWTNPTRRGAAGPSAPHSPPVPTAGRRGLRLSHLGVQGSETVFR